MHRFLFKTTHCMAATSMYNMRRIRLVMRLSPVLIKEDSGQQLISAPFTSPYSFGEMPNEVLATMEDDQLLARVAETSFKLPKK